MWEALVEKNNAKPGKILEQIGRARARGRINSISEGPRNHGHCKAEVLLRENGTFGSEERRPGTAKGHMHT